MTHGGRDAEGLNEPYVDLTSIFRYGSVCYITLSVVKTSGRHFLPGIGSCRTGGNGSWRSHYMGAKFKC